MRIIQGVAVADELVREIRALERDGTTLDSIGRRFHLSRAVVQQIVRRRAPAAPTPAAGATRPRCRPGSLRPRQLSPSPSPHPKVYRTGAAR
jgi:hypothetical protein